MKLASVLFLFSLLAASAQPAPLDAALNPKTEVDRGDLTQSAGREGLSSGLTVSSDTLSTSSSPIGSASCISSSPPISDSGFKALGEGLPEVAVVKLQQQLATPLEPEVRKLAKTKLAEAYLAAGLRDEALLQARDPEVGSPMLEAKIHAALGQWSEVLALCEKAGAVDEPALLLKAECLARLGRGAEGVALLERGAEQASENVRLRLAELYLDQQLPKKCGALLEAIKPEGNANRRWHQYLKARLFLEQGFPAYACGPFDDLLRDPQDVTENILAGAALGLTKAREQIEGLALADDVLEAFIWKYPNHSQLESIFRRLDEVYAGETNPPDSELRKWSKGPEPGRAGFATYYLAKGELREGKREQALKELEGFGERFQRHPILPEALWMRGRMLAEAGKFAQAQESMEAAMRAARNEAQRAEIEMASAAIHFQAGEYVLAATVFRSVGEHSPALWEKAVYNSALAWLHQGNHARFLEDYQELSRRNADGASRCDLILEEGLLQARQGNPQAEGTLHQLIRDFPQSPRVAEARLALAELYFAGKNPGEAARYIQAVNEMPVAAKTTEQADYLAIFVAEAATPRHDEKVIALCRTFLERYPASTELAAVRMKLGQIFFRQEDYLGAQNQFETLARENPSSDLVPAALFLAGQAAMKASLMSAEGVDHAIVLFEEVTQWNGPLKWHARLQQALAQERLGKQNEANILYDAILAADPAPAREIYFAAMAGKAENLLELGEKDQQAREQALALFEKLATAPGVNALLRQQALYKKGRCLEGLAKPAEALAAYYDVLQAGAAQPAEYYWFYKAGFDAGNLCETQEQWKSAIAIYQKMAGLKGPRSEESKARMTQLRLKHFIWE